MLLSLFCGAGGLDLGFERAGFQIGLAFDRRSESIASYNHNRPGMPVAHCKDVRQITLNMLDDLYGQEFAPIGLIGGPPCQSFSQANRTAKDHDERHDLPLVFCDILDKLNRRSPVHFCVIENVKGLCSNEHRHRLEEILDRLENIGFATTQTILNSVNYMTPQKRERLFIVGINRSIYPDAQWVPPPASTKNYKDVTVRSAIGDLMAPTFYPMRPAASGMQIHPNHWCMKPKSSKFKEIGLLIPGNASRRSFKTLSWDAPSITVAYGNREVHIHPNCQRRLSVYEAMLLQGFPSDYELVGSLSSQFTQVSEAVPPLMAEAVAFSVFDSIKWDNLADLDDDGALAIIPSKF